MKAPIYSDPRHRYALATSKLPENAEIIDLGGYKGCEKLIEIPDIKYLSLNIGSAWYNDEPHITFDGKNIPFQSFPYIICVDTLEHIPKKCRKDIIHEMVRTAEQKVVIITPFMDKTMEEYRFIEYAKKFNIDIKPSIDEHVKYGLPTIDEIESYLIGKEHIITYATPKRFFWDSLISQLFNSAVMKDADITNRSIQSLMEEELMNTTDNIDMDEAYRAVITISPNTFGDV